MALRILAAVALGTSLLVGSAQTAGAGEVTEVVEADTPAALAIAVSRFVFADGAAADVVVADPTDQDSLFEAAAFTGSVPHGAPLLLTGGEPGAMLTEAARAAGGPGGSAPATVWLYDVADPGFAAAGYTDVRTIDRSTLLTVWPGGNEGRILVAEPGNPAAGAAAAAFGAAWGIPLIVASSFTPPPGGFAATVHEALVLGAASVPDAAFTTVRRFTSADPATIAGELGAVVAAEQADGLPFLRVVSPVAADGYGTEPAPAALAAVVAASRQAEGAAPPLALVDGRPAVDPTSACATGSGRDAAASCLIAAAEGDTVLVTLRGATRPTAPSAGPTPAPTAPAARPQTLPATGAAPPPLIAPLVAAVGLLLVSSRARRRA